MQLEFTPYHLQEAARRLVATLTSNAFVEELEGRAAFENPTRYAVPHAASLPERLRAYERENHRAGFVYVAQDATALVKIGLTVSPQRRLFDARAWNPTLRFLAIWATCDMYGVEGALHARYATKRVSREWFALSAAEIEKLIS